MYKPKKLLSNNRKNKIILNKKGGVNYIPFFIDLNNPGLCITASQAN